GEMMDGEVKSDCAALNGLAEAVLASGANVRVLRDPTRGGVATTLCEFAESAGLGIELNEWDIPVRRSVAAACALLGLDPLYSANEGKMLCVVPQETARTALDAMTSHPLGADAAIIGRVTEGRRVILNTRTGGARVLRKLSGAQLPRI